MKTAGRRQLIGMLAIAVGLMLVSTAAAWYQPPGSGVMTYERQNTMHDDGYALQDLARMFEGRRTFDRDEAVRLARELEEGLGEALLPNFSPGAVVAGSRTAPWTWRNFGAFQAYSLAVRQSSRELAEVLDAAPTADEIRQQPG